MIWSPPLLRFGTAASSRRGEIYRWTSFTQQGGLGGATWVSIHHRCSTCPYRFGPAANEPRPGPGKPFRDRSPCKDMRGTGQGKLILRRAFKHLEQEVPEAVARTIGGCVIRALTGFEYQLVCFSFSAGFSRLSPFWESGCFRSAYSSSHMTCPTCSSRLGARRFGRSEGGLDFGSGSLGAPVNVESNVPDGREASPSLGFEISTGMTSAAGPS